MSARYAIPSSEEVKQLNETAGLQAATLLRLQCDELVQEVRCQPGKSGKALEEWIPALADALSGLPPCVLRGESIATGFRFDGCGVQQAISALMGAALEFEPPAAVNVVGSHAAGTMLKASGTQRVVDVAVSMPSSCLAPRDFVSYRYLAKRALYLGHLAAVLSSRSDLAKRCEVSSFRGDPCKPCIIISPNLNLNRQHHYLVRLLVSVPEGALDPSKLAPWRSNVRRLVQQESDASPPPTPRYNSSVLEDMGLISHSRAIRDALSGSESARACALLGKVWLAQRGFLASSDSICGFSWSMILVHLLETHAVSPRLTPLAMFQAVINFLACSAAVEGAGLEIPLGSPSWSDATQQLKAHSAAFPAVLLDAELGVNVLWRVSSSGWREVREAAQYSLKLLQHSPADAFSHLFMRFVGPLRRYDAFLSLSYSAWEPASCPGAGSHLGDALCDTTMDRAMADRVTAILSRALSDRVKAIRPMLPQDCRYKGVSQPDIVIVDGTKWAITDDPPPAPLLIVGLCLNPSSAGRIVDRGPSADDSAAAADFRGFWGDRSELRRFQDGAIVEAVVWDGSSPHHIVERISRCALCRHCPPLAEGQVGFCGDGTALESIWVGNDVVMTQGAISVFDEFIKKLKGLPGLPLRLNTALPASACLRYTSLLPPFGHPLAGSTQKGMTITTSQIDPIDTVLRFEASSLWPRDLKAVAAVRQAFLLRIREQLEKENDGKYTVSGDLACGGDALEVRSTFTSPSSLSDFPCLTVSTGFQVFSGGFCFRVWISCDVEELAMREVSRVACLPLPNLN
jgi:U3 small nucleolar RNA-associated protein 22